MAGVLKDYRCMAHGDFESRTGRCPYGCGTKMVQVVFLKPPAYVSGRTKSIDKTIAGMAREAGLTDMNNHGGDTGVFVRDPAFTKAQNDMNEMMMRGQTYAGELAKGENAIPEMMKGAGFAADNAIEQAKPSLTQPKPIIHASYSPKTLPKPPD